MLIAHYIGPPREGLLAKISHWAIRTGQRAPYDNATHTEAIHGRLEDGTVLIASATIEDGARRKQCLLRPERWTITDMPMWPVEVSVEWFDKAIAQKMRYDRRGALATVLPGKQDSGKVYCTEAVLSPFVAAPHYYTPALGLSLCLSFGTDVTEAFFKGPSA
jgi:hypothetical protein